MNEVAPRPQFPVTRWSVVVAAAGQGRAARQALEEICRLYWFPLYAFARQYGCNIEDAEDETQAFLSQVANADSLAKASPCLGKLRNYLLAAFQHDLIDSTRRRQSLKRGGGLILSLDGLRAEARFQDAAPQSSPAASFERAWAITCLEQTVSQLAAEYAARGRSALFAQLRIFLDPNATANYTEAAQEMDADTNAVRQAVFRLRHRFRILLRQTIADTLQNPTETMIDEELASLRAILSIIDTGS